jgi:hypothetical protein
MWELMILVLCLKHSFSASEEDAEGPRFMCILLEAALASLISRGRRGEERGREKRKETRDEEGGNKRSRERKRDEKRTGDTRVKE